MTIHLRRATSRGCSRRSRRSPTTRWTKCTGTLIARWVCDVLYLGNLFQEKTETTPMSNKINHTIISTAYASLKMGHLEECLQSISEGLRISQNNSDEESINNCIIYLYKIAEQLGKYQEEILLA